MPERWQRASGCHQGGGASVIVTEKAIDALYDQSRNWFQKLKSTLHRNGHLNQPLR
jgi:bifunctional pyridoxal-dependent enzyme with beta-cystathionase and maltose regulon repressor activities